MGNPKVFISYSWDSENHKKWVIALSNELRKNGIDAVVDEFITQKGTVNLNRMMIENIQNSDYTVAILTDKYAEKANSFKGGAGYETSLLINDIVDNIEKIIPIVRFNGDVKKAIPFYLRGISYIDFSNDILFKDKLEELIYKIFKVDRIEVEPLGDMPNLKPKKVSIDTIHQNKDEELIPDFNVVTDRDKSKFMKSSFKEIINNLKELADKTKLKNSYFDYDIEFITNNKIIVKYYLNGMEKYSVKMWFGNSFYREENICLSYGRFVIDGDNSCNEIIACEINEDKELKLKMTMTMFGNRGLMDAKDISIELWKSIVQNFK